MAWCESCERYLTPAALDAGGACPSCGAEVEHPFSPQRAGGVSGSSGEPGTLGPSGAPRASGGSRDAAAQRIPWHFWLLLAAATVYLGWRAVQGVALLLSVPGAAGVL